MLTGEVVVISKARHKELLEKEKKLKQMEPYGALVIDKPQPATVWALFYKEHRKRRVAWSYDGPPSAAYIKLVDERKFQVFLNKIKDIASGSDLDNEIEQALRAAIKEFTKDP